MKKYLILTQCFPPVVGGIENLMHGLAATLAEQQLTTVLADTPAGEDDAHAPFTLHRYGGLKLLRRWRKARAAARLIRSGDYCHIICDSWKSAELLPPPQTLTTANIPLTILAHGTEYPPSPTAAKRQRIQRALQNASSIAAVSAATRARVENCGISPQRLRVWHPPINTPAPPTTAALRQARQHWADGQPNILTIARLVPRKGIDTALHAIAALKQQHPNIRYLIAGGGAQENELRQLAQTLNLQDNVKFLGTVAAAEKSALHSDATLYLLPCRAEQNDIEGYGLVFVEAAHFGVPAVTGTAGGAKEAVDDGITGIHCDGTSAESVANAIRQILNQSPAAARQMQENCRQKANASNWQTKIKTLLQE